MYIVIMTNKNKEMMLSMREEIKKQFPTWKFSTQDIEHRGTQLHLEGPHSEDKPNMFALGFAAAWEALTLSLQDKK